MNRLVDGRPDHHIPGRGILQMDFGLDDDKEDVKVIE